MSPEAYRDFTERLTSALKREPDVLGLVASGSMSGVGQAADAWSDHDFFVVVRPGTQEHWRSELAWLPDAERVVLAFRETAHGLKVVYRDGHLLEFAVFEPDELQLARVNRYRVLMDGADIEARMRTVREATDAAPRCDDRFLMGQFLTQLLVGVARFRRGERLSGHRLVKAQALEHLLALIALHLPPADAAAPDGLDPFRRVERAWPLLAREIEGALAEPVDISARRLFDLGVRELSGRIDFPSDAIAAIGAALTLSAIPAGSARR